MMLVAFLHSNMLAVLAVLCWILGVGILIASYRREISCWWREPVMLAPVLIIESDDWGPGPPADGSSLQALLQVLRKHQGADGRPPVITLGVVLAAPRPVGAFVAGELVPEYSPSMLDDECHSGILTAMREGSAAGLFALQLHGREHFWPPALMEAARQDPRARAFLKGDPSALRHEVLPSHLQSRWIDAARLPSRALDRAAIEDAVADETACFRRVFGVPAHVAVPVTFVWTTEVEVAWARHGIRVVVTPGSRNVGRDGEGQLVADGSILRNGDPAPGGMCYVVRDVYFEPTLGHTAERTLREIRERHRLGRPALVEMHRCNFTGGQEKAGRAIAELDRLLAGALATIPKLRFMSTEALAGALRTGDPALVDRRPAARIRAFILRAATRRRLRKLAWLSGLALPAMAIYGTASLLLAGASDPKSAVES